MSGNSDTGEPFGECKIGACTTKRGSGVESGKRGTILRLYELRWVCGRCGQVMCSDIDRDFE